MSREPTVVLIGATGFTGRLVAAALVRHATGTAPPLLAARDPARLERLAAELGGTPGTQPVDVTDPASLARLIQPGDVVINTAGPFDRLGEPVVRACVERGAHYLDTTGEQPFMRAMHARYHAAARSAGVSVVNGMAFEYALGDCAAALAAAALAGAGEAGALQSVDVVYAWLGSASSVGTRRTSLRILGRRAWVLEEGAWRRRPLGARRRRVTLRSGRTLDAVSFGSGEVVTVPRHVAVGTVRGWIVLGRPAARLLPLLAPMLPFAVPALLPLLDLLVARGGDPSPADRQGSRFTIRVEAVARDGRRAAAEVRGADPYGLTAAIAVAGARRAADAGAARGVVAPAQLVDPASFLRGLRDRGVDVDVRVDGPASGGRNAPGPVV